VPGGVVEVKGVSVRAAPQYVNARHATRYDDWIGSLSAPARHIVETVLPSSWYPFEDSLVEPTRKVCDLFFGGAVDGAYEVGKASAELSLRGVYKAFVRLGSPEFIIKRASGIFSNMIRPGEFAIAKSASCEVVLHMKVPQSDAMLELRMIGWIQQALAISGCKQPKVRVERSIAEGDPVTEFVARWQ
jgi:hypothetical protein